MAEQQMDLLGGPDDIDPHQYPMRASFSTCRRGGYQGVIKEQVTDAWLWHCERLHDGHGSIKKALDCARERMAKEGSRG